MTERLQIRVRKLHPEAVLPKYAHGPQEDAGMDLCAVAEVTIPPGGWVAVSTGLAIEIPPGHEGQVRPRSGLAAQYGLTLLNSPGTIDPGYRGELRILMINHGHSSYTVTRGERVAQLIVSKYGVVDWEWAEELDGSARSDRGFGSTGS